MNVDNNARYINECIEDLQYNKGNTENTLKSIRRMCDRIQPNFKCVDIFITENRDKVFGMSIYPSKDVLAAISADLLDKDFNKIVTNQMNNNLEYVIEIDSRILYDKALGFDSDEVTAILLHELGHVKYFNLRFMKAKEIFMEALSNEGVNINSIDNTDAIAMSLAKMYVMDMVETLKPLNEVDKLSMEQHADNLAFDLGYGNSLASALNKYSKYSARQAVKSDNIAEATTYIKLMLMCKTRQQYVLDLVKNERRIERKNYVKGVLDDVLKLMQRKKYGRQVVRMETHLDDILSEGFIRDFLLSPIRMSQKDIDEINIEYQMLETYDDKMSLMYKIHKRLSQVADAKRKTTSNKEVTVIVSSYETQLQDLLQKTMAFKVVDKNYGVFVKYPKGYEG